MKSCKKLIALALFICMAATVGSGCSSTRAKSGTSSGKPITLQFWTISLQPTFTDFFNKLDSDYEAKHPNVKVQWTDLPQDTIQQKLITSIAGGTSPDVVNLNTSMALSLAGKKAVVDLNKEATAAQRGIYIASLYNSAKVGNSVYAFPWYASPFVMMYNKALFTKAGISVPKTFDEALKATKKMKESTGAYLYNPEGVVGLMFLEGIPILNSTSTKAAFNTTAAYNLISQYKSQVQQDLLPKSGWGSYSTELKLFETSKLAIIDTGGSSLKRIKEEAPDIYANIAITEPMTGKSGVVHDPLMNVVVPTASKHHKEAIDFAWYITNDDSQLAFCKEVAIFPSTTKAAEDSYFISDTTTLEGQARALSAKSLSKSKDFSLGIDQQSDVTKAIGDIYESGIEGNTDLKTTFNTAEQNVNQLLAQKSGSH